MEMKQNNAATMISQGIETLIDRLKEDGVNAGREEAEKIVQAAQEKANTLLNNAQAKAKQILDEASQRIQQEQKAAEDALYLAAKNMRLELRQNLIDRFTEEVRHLVHKELDNEEMIRQLITLIACNTAEQARAFKAQKIEIQLPEKVLDFNDIRQNPDLMNNDPLKALVQSLMQQMLKEGMDVVVNPGAKNLIGIKVHLLNEEIVLDLSEDAVSSLLVKHMQPRFRALLEGLLK
jgi:V/A-type H+-transporting ATPase subunit E